MSITTNEPQASEKQYAFLSTLIREKNLDAIPAHLQDVAADVFNGEPVAKRAASALITALIAAPRMAKPATAAAVEAGMYLHDGVPVKVQQSGSGRLYAKELREGVFEYVPGLQFKLRADERMSLEQAMAYGKATGTCCVCAAELTNPESIQLGIGPVCRSRF